MVERGTLVELSASQYVGMNNKARKQSAISVIGWMVPTQRRCQIERPNWTKANRKAKKKS